MLDATGHVDPDAATKVPVPGHFDVPPASPRLDTYRLGAAPYYPLIPADQGVVMRGEYALKVQTWLREASKIFGAPEA